MKLKTITFAAMLLALGVFVACSSDDENIYGGLDASSLIGRTKAAPADWTDPDENPNLHIPTDEENACGKYALTARYIQMWREKYGDDAFTRLNNPLTAESIYDQFGSYLTQHPELEMNNDGSMPLSTYTALGNAFQVGGESLIGQSVMFDQNNTPQDYLNDPDNIDNVASVIMEDSNGNRHIVNVRSHNNYRLSYDGYNGQSQSYNGGNVYYNDHNNHTVSGQYYQIIGIVTK